MNLRAMADSAAIFWAINVLNTWRHARRPASVDLTVALLALRTALRSSNAAIRRRAEAELVMFAAERSGAPHAA